MDCVQKNGILISIQSNLCLKKNRDAQKEYITVKKV